MDSTQDSVQDSHVQLQDCAYPCEDDGSSQSDSESVSGASSLGEDFVENEDGGQELIMVASCEVG
jgi:hypothetical protein